MKLPLKILFLAVTVLLCNSCMQSLTTPSQFKLPDNSNSSPSSFVLSISGVISETNNNRVVRGLNPLTENWRLDTAADLKMRDMFARQYFDHFGPDGSFGTSELLGKVNYEYSTYGENIALGNFKDNKDLVEAWMTSSGHRENILNEHYRDIGVAVGEGIFQGKHEWIAVQIFGAPRD